MFVERERLERIVLTEDQVRTLGRPLRGELLSAFQNFGPASVADVAARLGQPPKSMYYQVRKMVAAGLLRPVGTQGSGVREESLYDVVADKFELRRGDLDDEYRRQVTGSVEQILRTAAREFGAANVPEAPRLPFVLRRTASLTPEAVEELHALLRQAVRFMEERHDPRNPVRVSLTALVNPLPSKRKSDPPNDG